MELRQTQPEKYPCNLRVYRCFDLKLFSCDGVRECQFGRAKHQVLPFAIFSEKAVLCAVAMARVAEYRVANMSEMTSELLFSARCRSQYDMRDSRLRIAPD